MKTRTEIEVEFSPPKLARDKVLFVDPILIMNWLLYRCGVIPMMSHSTLDKHLSATYIL